MSGINSLKGDGDPLDICVLAERTVNHGDIIVPAIPIGGFRMIDNGEADDKIIAVAAHDPSINYINNIEELPKHFFEELRHFFEEYKRLENNLKYERK